MRNSLCVAFAGLALSAVAVRAEVPPPSATPVEVIVSGRTSTAKDIKIVNVGQEIPKTYSGDHVRNTPGFDWWVSRHYALKTDYGEDMARLYLTLLELAYPHYVELFGGEPKGIENTRMTVVYASSGKQLEKAMESDGRKWTYAGGGEAYEGVNVAYQYQLYDVEHVWDQPRYIVIHECVHLFQNCINGSVRKTPRWFYEGIADLFANHVYDAERKRLTVNVFDKAGPLHKPQYGLPTLQAHSDRTLEKLIKRQVPADRSEWFVMCAFFNSTPDRMQKFRLLRDGMMNGGKKHDEEIVAVFGPWDKLNAEFKTWVESRKLTFFTPPWRQWSQDGDTLWGFNSPPGDGSKWSYIDVFLPPGEKPQPDPWRMDWPGVPMPSFVGPVRRGVEEPSVGCVVDLSKGPQAGRAGFGMGVVHPQPPKAGAAAGAGDEMKPGYLKLLMDASGALTVEGEEVGIAARSFPLPQAVRDAMAAGGHRAGITATITHRELKLTVRARDPKAAKDVSFSTALPITSAQRGRLLKQPLCLLAQGGWHGVTPFFDPDRMPEPDLARPASPDPWRNPGDQQLYGVYKAARGLGDKAPASLLKLKEKMLTAADKDLKTQRKALAAHGDMLLRVVRDVGQCGADSQAIQAAVCDLTGLGLELDLIAGKTPNEFVILAATRGAAAHKVTGTVLLGSSLEQKGPGPETISVTPRGLVTVRRAIGVSGAFAPFDISAQAELVWRGQKISLRASRSCGTSIPAWWVIGPFDNPAETTDVKHPVETEEVDLEKEYEGKGGAKIAWRKVEQTSFAAEHLVNYISLFGEEEKAAAYNLAWIESDAEQDAVFSLGSDDGAVAWLNGVEVHRNLVGRGYSSEQDRVAIHFRKGRNTLLVKVTQGEGGWVFGGHLRSSGEAPLSGVRVTLAP